MNGLIKENLMVSGQAAVAGTESGVDDLRRAVGLVEEARAVFADVPGNVRGRTLEVGCTSLSLDYYKPFPFLYI